MKPILLSVDEVSLLLNTPTRTVRHHCSNGSIKSNLIRIQGRTQYRIPLASLPEPAQLRYWVQEIRKRPKIDQRAYLLGLNLAEVQEREVARLAGVVRKEMPLEPLPWTDAELEQKGAWFSRLPEGMQEMANYRMSKLMAFTAYMKALPDGTKKTEARRDWCEVNGVSMSVLYVWEKMVKNLAPNMWRYALAPGYGCEGRPMKDFSGEAWTYILEAWGNESQPALKPIYRRAVGMAAEKEWVIPSYSAVKRRIDDLSPAVKAFWRGGEKALEELIPPQQRDYSALAVHEVWNADGRKADVHCRWPDGTVSRPIVLGWMDIRSRVLVGWSIGQTESAFLVMQALGDALERTRHVPRRVYLDNGRAFAAKQMTGGQAKRNRFKVAEDEIEGIITLLGCEVVWAKPYNGKAKPIESFWRTLAEAEKRPEFTGAYCGNNTQNKPGNHDVKNAVPVSLYEKIIREEVEAYHQRPHRGDAMDGKSPHAIYSELLDTARALYVTEEQMRCCLMAAQQVKVNRSGQIEVMGNRYSCDELIALNSKGPYTARYDPKDATKPLHLFDGIRFVMRVPLVDKTGFMDQEAAQKYGRAKNAIKKMVREQANAHKTMQEATDWLAPRERAVEPVSEPVGNTLPKAKVVTPLRPTKNYKAPPTPVDDDEITPEERRQMAKAREIGMAKKVAHMVESGELPPEYAPHRRMAGG